MPRKKYDESVIDSALLDSLYDFESGDLAEIMREIARKFTQEYGWRVAQIGLQPALIDWLQGCALNIPIYNVDVIEFAERMGSLEKDASEREQDKILGNYWRFMSMAILKRWRKFKIDPLNLEDFEASEGENSNTPEQMPDDLRAL